MRTTRSLRTWRTISPYAPAAGTPQAPAEDQAEEQVVNIPAVPPAPNIQESRGQTAPVRTYQDLLTSAYDEALFDHYATSQLAQTTLRSVIGQSELDDLLAHRETINQQLQEIIDRQTAPWGVKVTAVEVKDVVLPDTMKRAMARQAEVERDRRARIINAQGEFQAAEKLVAAAEKIAEQPVAMQLRFLQTIQDISSEHNTHTILPLPIDLLRQQIRADNDFYVAGDITGIGAVPGTPIDRLVRIDYVQHVCSAMIRPWTASVMGISMWYLRASW